MSDSWPREFALRMQRFGDRSGRGVTGFPLSIKIRVVSGCFHPEHSAQAYRLIDRAIREGELDEHSLEWVEHESGPELLLWVPLVTAGAALSAAVINLVVTVLKARSEGVKAGDTPREPVELIVRTSRSADTVVEEKVLRFNPDDPVHVETIRDALNAATQRTLADAPGAKKKRGRSKPKKQGVRRAGRSR